METIKASPEVEAAMMKFMGVTAQSKIAVIVPLFGYWSDIKNNQFTAEVLKAVLFNAKSMTHYLTFVFVGENRVTPDVANVILGMEQAGNTMRIAVDKGSTYSDYLKKGIDVALSETDCQFLVVLSPWAIIQPHSIDVIVDRANRADEAKIICGYNVRGILRDNFSKEEFETLYYQAPDEVRSLNFDFLGMARYVAEMAQLDTSFKTHSYLARDLWQNMFSRGYESIESQRVPVFCFDVDWKDFEPVDDVETDKQYFLTKWKYEPNI